MKKYHKCKLCRGSGFFSVQYYYETDNDKDRLIYYTKVCGVCEGRGEVDWVTNISSDFRDGQLQYLIRQQKLGKIFALQIDIVTYKEKEIRPYFYAQLIRNMEYRRENR